MEKEFSFSVFSGGGKANHVMVKESDLSNVQIGFLLGELTKFHNKVPEIVKEKFLKQICDQIMDNHHESVYKRMDELTAKIIGGK